MVWISASDRSSVKMMTRPHERMIGELSGDSRFARATGSIADAAPNGAEDVEQPKTIVTQRWLEVNPNASAACMRRLSGHAVLGDGPFLQFFPVPR